MSALAEAISALHGGGIVVIPTDTVYGVAGRADLADAVQAIFEVKGRPKDRALPVLGAGIDDLRSVASFSEAALRLAERFWPGPLTLVVPRAERFTFDLGGTDRATVGVRAPAHPLALELLGETGPLAVTSANLSGHEAASTVEQAREMLGDAVAVYLDGGPLAGSPSTVVRVGGELEVLREGGIGEGALRDALQT